jgi:hypothetical protein
MKGSHLFWLSRSKGMTVYIWIRDYNPPRYFQKKISGRSKHNEFPFTVELIMNSQFDWMEFLYSGSIIDSGSQTCHKTLKYSLHLKQGCTVIPHPKNELNH